jgi:hypothetical protein
MPLLPGDSLFVCGPGAVTVIAESNVAFSWILVACGCGTWRRGDYFVGSKLGLSVREQTIAHLQARALSARRSVLPLAAAFSIVMLGRFRAGVLRAISRRRSWMPLPHVFFHLQPDRWRGVDLAVDHRRISVPATFRG